MPVILLWKERKYVYKHESHFLHAQQDDFFPHNVRTRNFIGLNYSLVTEGFSNKRQVQHAPGLLTVLFGQPVCIKTTHQDMSQVGTITS